jgi:uncharacterized membrane protein YqjE
MNETGNERGIFASLRRLLATALEIAQVRLALLGTEVELEKQRLFEGLLWGALALLAIGVGLVALCGFIVLLFWDGYRLAALGVITFVFLAAGVMLLRESKRRLHTPGGMFNVNLSELQRDHDGLVPQKPHEQ